MIFNFLFNLSFPVLGKSKIKSQEKVYLNQDCFLIKCLERQ